MQFEKGNKAAVGGRKEKPFRDALLLVLNEKIKDAEGEPRKLRALAEKLVEKALTGAGDTEAIKAIADRVDGKPVQALANDEDNPLFPTTQTDEQLNERLANLLRKSGAGGTPG